MATGVQQEQLIPTILKTQHFSQTDSQQSNDDDVRKSVNNNDGVNEDEDDNFADYASSYETDRDNDSHSQRRPSDGSVVSESSSVYEDDVNTESPTSANSEDNSFIHLEQDADNSIHSNAIEYINDNDTTHQKELAQSDDDDSINSFHTDEADATNDHDSLRKNALENSKRFDEFPETVDEPKSEKDDNDKSDDASSEAESDKPESHEVEKVTSKDDPSQKMSSSEWTIEEPCESDYDNKSDHSTEFGNIRINDHFTNDDNDNSVAEHTPISNAVSESQLASSAIPPSPTFLSSMDDRTDADSIMSKSSFSSDRYSDYSRTPVDTVDDVDNEKSPTNRVSVASLGENPELNDISLDDEEREEENSGGWFSNHLPRTPNSLKSFASYFRPLSTLAPLGSSHTEQGEDDDLSGELNFPKSPNSVRSFTSIFSSRPSSASPPTTVSDNTESRHMSMASLMSTGSSTDLLLAKLDKDNQILADDPKILKANMTAVGQIKKSFERVQTEAAVEDDIDWDFWGLVVNDYEAVAKSQPKVLSRTIQKGIPTPLRGMIWQLMSKSKDVELETIYAQLLKKTSVHEKLIMRDLNRTFPKHEYFRDQNGIGQEGLFNVVKAYSLYDREVGYCQGISFVVGPLLLNMPDEGAFCVLVRLMTIYNLRGNFLPGMDGLQLRLYQFDRLVEDMLPKVNSHLKTQGINSSMYASQWFMTLFAYKFPLSLVFRIYDTIFTEGVEALFRFCIALLKKNEAAILGMEFEALLEFLKSGLYNSYAIIPTGVLAKEVVSEHQYDANEFVKDAYSVSITMRRLNKYQKQYYAIQEAERQRQAAESSALEQLRIANNHLSNQIKQLEASLQTINREHIELANVHVGNKVELVRVKDENDALRQTVADLRLALDNAPAAIEEKLRAEMDSLAKKNVELVTQNNKLEDQLATTESMLIEYKMRYAESENEREALRRKWNDLKRALN